MVADDLGGTQAQLHVAFRCDASLAIGTGHVMRCLTLADALRERDVRSTFISRDLPGNINTRIMDAGHRLERLAPPGDNMSTSSSECGQYREWLGVGMDDEISQSRTLVAKIAPDLVVTDHYALGSSWHEAVCDGCKVMAIDDLADREHHCDLLLDQNFGRRAEDYYGLVSERAQRLIGLDYALLRPEFLAARDASLARRKELSEPLQLLVSMGGVDRENSTGEILRVLSRFEQAERLAVTVIMGPNAPHLAAVERQATALSFPTKVVSNVSNMADLLSGIDLAIGAAGGSVWERCCLGVPSLLLNIADNQRPAASALDQAGAAIALGDLASGQWEVELSRALDRLLQPAELQGISQEAGKLVDGRGAARVASHVIAQLLSVREVVESDARTIWEWRHAGGAARYYQSGEETPFEDHVVWLQAALMSGDRHLLMVERCGVPVGHIRLDRDPDTPSWATLSISISPALRGKRLAQAILMAGIDFADRAGFATLKASVHMENTASHRLFVSCGFRETGRDRPFIHFTRQLGGLRAAIDGVHGE